MRVYLKLNFNVPQEYYFNGYVNNTKSEDVDLSLNELVEKESQIEKLEKEINKLKSQIKRTKQFNQKVELNALLRQREMELNKNHTK